MKRAVDLLDPILDKEGVLMDKLFDAARWIDNLNRDIRARIHKLRYGFRPEEWWALSLHTVKYMLPRIKHMKENHASYHIEFDNPEDWEYTLGEIIWFMEKFIEIDEGLDPPLDDVLGARYKRGEKLFKQYVLELFD